MLRTLFVCMLMSFIAADAYSAPALSVYRILDRISGPDGKWDYATIDSSARRLYIGRSYGVMAVDLDTLAVLDTHVPGSMVHGIAAVGDTGLFVSTNGVRNTATIFEGRSAKVVGEVSTGKDPDAVVFEPKTGLIATIDHDGGDVTLIDPRRRVAIGTIKVGGELEFAAADGNGLVYINVADTHRVAVVDIAARRVVYTIPLAGCKNPTGLAYDAEDSWVISVCFNGVAMFIDASTRRQIGSIRTGEIPDAVIWDAARRLVFVPSFKDGNLTVISAQSSRDLRVIQILPTQPGTRTGALDAKTGRLYLPTSRLMPSKTGDYPQPVPGTFEILVVGKE
jgi:DNA-binding beta-propeller fold protein YncE